MVLLLLFLGWWQSEKPKEIEVKIGMLGPLTGGASEYGVEARNGAQLAISQLNQEQNKYSYKLVALDDKADPDLAGKKAQALVKNEEILAVIGSITTPTTLAAGKVFQKEKLVAISPSATGPAISQLGDFVFRVCPSDTYQGRALADLVVKEEGFKKVAILWDEKNASYSGALADSFTKRAEQLGGIIVKRVAYQEGQTDFSSFLQEVKKENPEVLLIPGYYTEAALIAQQVKKMGWQIPIFGGDGLHSSSLIEIGGKAVDGVKLTTFFISSNPDPKVQEFVNAYQERFGSKPGWVAAHSYDAMKVIAAALNKNLSRKGVQEGLSQIKGFKGVTGTISFDENGDIIGKEILKLEIKEGQFKTTAVYK